MNTTTQKSIQPYQYIVIGQDVRIINTNSQTLRVSREQIIRQLERGDIDPHRRIMYEGALRALENRS